LLPLPESLAWGLCCVRNQRFEPTRSINRVEISGLQVFLSLLDATSVWTKAGCRRGRVRGGFGFYGFDSGVPGSFQFAVQGASECKICVSREVRTHPLLNHDHGRLSASGTATLSRADSVLWIADSGGLRLVFSLNLVVQCAVVALGALTLKKRSVLDCIVFCCNH